MTETAWYSGLAERTAFRHLSAMSSCRYWPPAATAPDDAFSSPADHRRPDASPSGGQASSRTG